MFFLGLPIAFALILGGAAEAETKDPLVGLREAYQSTQILFLGTSNHLSSQSHRLVLKFLEEIKGDPHLKFIGLERIQDLAPAYAELSVKNYSLDEVAKKTLTTPSQTKFAICGMKDEWAWMDSQLLPKVREINTIRTTSNKLLAVPLDGASLADAQQFQKDVLNEGSGVTVAPENCSYIQFKNPRFTDRSLDILTTYNREVGSADNFQKNIWKQLGPQDKAIVIYHFGHLLRGFESCQAESKSGASWTSNWQKTGWIDLFLTQNPSARNKIKVLLFDEILPKQNPSGVLVVSQKNRTQTPKSNLFFTPEKNASELTGLDLLLPDAFFRASYLGGQHRSHSSIRDLFDFMISFSESGESFGFPKAEVSFPQFCAPPSPSP